LGRLSWAAGGCFFIFDFADVTFAGFLSFAILDLL
jgi:hypothetical protein